MYSAHPRPAPPRAFPRHRVTVHRADVLPFRENLDKYSRQSSDATFAEAVVLTIRAVRQASHDKDEVTSLVSSAEAASPSSPSDNPKPTRRSSRRTAPRTRRASDKRSSSRSAEASPTDGLRRFLPKRRKTSGSHKTRAGKVHLVGKHVSIECGRYKGETGIVVRGGNGYYCVQLDDPASRQSRHGATGSDRSSSGMVGHNVMKRSSDLRPLSPVAAATDDVGQGDVEQQRHHQPIQNRRRTARVARQQQQQCTAPPPTTTSPAASSANNTAPTPSAKPETWMHRRVYIKAGKHRGHSGVIRRSGHGFYCVHVPSIGDVMKRASDLELSGHGRGRARSRSNSYADDYTSADDESDTDQAPPPDPNDPSLSHAASILMDIMTADDLPPLPSAAGADTKVPRPVEAFLRAGVRVDTNAVGSRLFGSASSAEKLSYPSHELSTPDFRSKSGMFLWAPRRHPPPPPHQSRFRGLNGWRPMRLPDPAVTATANAMDVGPS